MSKPYSILFLPIDEKITYISEHPMSIIIHYTSGKKFQLYGKHTNENNDRLTSDVLCSILQNQYNYETKNIVNIVYYDNEHIKIFTHFFDYFKVVKIKNI